jgi:hypothetical protein
MSSDSWKSLQAGLDRKFPDSASLIMLETGFIDYGSNLAAAILCDEAATSPCDNLESPPPSPKVLGALLRETMIRIGWGVVSISCDVESGTSVSFTVDNCTFCSDDASRYPCNFLRGVTIGLATHLYSNKYISSTSCSVENREHVCKINLASK